jgi:methionyl-tRNA synthetase
MGKYLVTSALIYANGSIHLGHMAGAYLPADIYVRYRKLNGDDVIFISGTDEHGVPITLKAESEGVSPREIADRYHKIVKDAYYRFGVHFDNYSGTAREVHYRISERFFLDLYETGHIMTKTEEQFYDEKAGRFLPDRYVEGTCPKCGFIKARGDQCDKCGSLLNSLELIDPESVISQNKPVIKETKHWYLRLQDFEPRLKEWVSSNTHWKDNVRNFVLGWIKDGLHERSITRDLDWGIPVPLPDEDAKGKVLYVWFDAPIGYISSTVEWATRIGDPERWRDYWQNPDCKLVHFIGKDNIPFHAITWPAVLMGQKENYILPYDIPANEYLTLEGKKLSTSNNWAIWIEEYLEEFPPDPLRYFLAANAPETKDSDFSWKAFQEKNNEELANILGNFANRTLTFINNFADGKIPPADYTDDDLQIFSMLEAKVGELTASFENYKVREAAKLMMDIARIGNKYFDETKPWVLKNDDSARLNTVLNVCLNILRVLAVTMFPIIPFSSEKLWTMLAEKNPITEERWEGLVGRRVEVGQKIGNLEILFVKYDDDIIQAQLDKLFAKSSESKGEKKMESIPKVSIKDFQNLDIRVAEIIEAEPLPKSKKLVKLKIKVGEDTKQILAGIKEFYAPEELIGRKIAVVNNLEPATLMGEVSEGMLLAASDADKTRVSLIEIPKDAQSGDKVS